MHLGNKISKNRIEAGLSQAQLAHKIGVDVGTISRWERDINTPHPIMLAKLKRILGIEI